jgi:hypothetical protein
VISIQSVPVQPGEEMHSCCRSCITLQLTTKVMRMKRVWSICFVKDNQGDEDETCLEYLLRMKRVWSICPSIYGTPSDVRVCLHGDW